MILKVTNEDLTPQEEKKGREESLIDGLVDLDFSTPQNDNISPSQELNGLSLIGQGVRNPAMTSKLQDHEGLMDSRQGQGGHFTSPMQQRMGEQLLVQPSQVRSFVGLYN